MIDSVISNQNSLIAQNPSLITVRNSLFGGVGNWLRKRAESLAVLPHESVSTDGKIARFPVFSRGTGKFDVKTGSLETGPSSKSAHPPRRNYQEPKNSIASLMPSTTDLARKSAASW